ncbi:MAG: hypothetical protein AB8B63_21335 [Granulosicoccus sp.]
MAQIHDTFGFRVPRRVAGKAHLRQANATQKTARPGSGRNGRG